ncbi:peptide chain release factor N(5)-glutamine methyltransferase [Corallincola holothuriorum]|uniref:Release factor glutamine methyltransferase n=1 Tax=Corallincola holothuriorum TaxID=2282215 RepID=A0A368NHF9_9GAMM|nr:peptide chain release factor N(5)-glutamine methyltransferase [Corallincola holothuriorum]RCU48839.1 peptide chain release factor N(5)-glutamine methyltransferase [Corallincola holothuriorum]
MHSIAALLRWAKSALADCSDSASLDADVLLCFLLDKPRSYLLTWPEKELDEETELAFRQLVAQRIAGHPVAHLTGVREFWSLPLAVSPDTLIPRPDTEVLVEVALDLPLPASARVVDLGTGTGAIALALASERPAWQIYGVDRMAGAITLAKSNAQRLGLERCQWQQSDWLACFSRSPLFDLIVSNPPYIDANDPHLREGDVRFEPLSALVAEESGLADIRTICEQAKTHLTSPGWLLIEHGWQQGAQVAALFESAGFVDVKVINDYAGNPRCTLGCWQRDSEQIHEPE